MGHYMSSMARAQAEQIGDVDESASLDQPMTDAANQEAAEAAIDAVLLADIAEPVLVLPSADVGTRVVYIPRPGHSRMGRTEFPADVLHVNKDDGSVALFVIMEAEDLATEDRVHQMVNEDDRHCWRHVRGGDVGMGVAGPVHDMAQRLSAVEEELGMINARVFGDYNDPPKSVMDFLDEFDVRICAMEQATKEPAVKRRARKTKA